jgi:hypothetical protein
MGIMRINHVFLTILAFLAMILIVQPVCAANSSVSIAYSGSGGSYIGDTIFFNGKDMAGNVTLIKISGPGLPAAGVPLYDLNGKPGTGNSIEVNPDGSWRFLWYSASVNGSEKLQTARYTFTVQDISHPELTDSASILLKKAEFNMAVTPNPARIGDYVELVGNAEQGTGSVRVDVVDNSGQISHTFIAPVGADGYFNYGFHVDMQPGQYRVNVGYPSRGTSLQRTLDILPSVPLEPTLTERGTTPGITTNPEVTTPAVPPASPAPSVGTGSISVLSTPSNASVQLDSVFVGHTPITLDEIAAGQHTVTIQAPGYIAYSLQVTVKEGETGTVSPALVKTPSLAPLPPVIAVCALIVAGGISLLWSRGREEN